ncbi:MAG: YibE/F family protein [Candidatus Buchananbacteria bacterium]
MADSNISDEATSTYVTSTEGEPQEADKSLKAVVVKVLEERTITKEDGTFKQQNLQLQLLTGPNSGKTVIYKGISDLEVVGAGYYKEGDRVFVTESKNEEGNTVYYVVDYIRSGSLLWLVLLFIAVVLVIGYMKGFRAILALVVSFLFIIKVMVPMFLASYNPLAVGLIGSFIVLLIIVYITEGFNKKSHFASLAILISLIFTAVLAIIFSNASHLTGQASEDVIFLMSATKTAIDFKGLLLAGIIVGTLGVLDDVVIGQVEAVLQIKNANPDLSSFQAFRMAMKVGRSHLGAIINTLFLAYVGASLPLVLLFNVHQAPFVTFSQIINNELVATEIVMTLVGVIGLCSAVPIATILAAKYLKADKIVDSDLDIV